MIKSEIQRLSEQLNRLIEDNLESLSSGTRPRWGMMTPQHMVEHLALQFTIARGKIEIDVFDRDKALDHKHRLLSGEWNFPRNLKVALIPKDKPPELRFLSLDKAKEDLLQELEMFDEYYRDKPKARPEHTLPAK